MRRYFLIFATAILLVAAFLRFWQLETYPPGPHFDEAANILITRSIAFGGADLFPITNSYQGRETLYHYYNAFLFRVIGEGEFTMRLSSAYAGLVTVAVSMALGRAMFRGRRGMVVGLLVGILMTTSFHQILMSRQMYRAITLPLMQSLALLFLWRGLNTKKRGWVWLILGGVFAGGALYTYMASRLFPLWLLLAGGFLLYADRAHFPRRLAQGMVFFGVMALVAVPIGVYAINHPDIFFGRLNEVTNESEVVVSLGESVRRHVEMFFLRGEDGNLRYNIPGRPYFNPIEGILFILGIGYALWMLGKRERGTERAAYFLILLSPLMVIPSVISVGGFPPNHMRSLGMVPLIFFLPALGTDFLMLNFSRVANFRPNRALLGGAVGVVLLISAFIVGRQYFQWAGRADLFYQADGDLAAVAEWLPVHVEENTRVYVASFHREHPTLITGWDGAITWMGFDSLFLPPPDHQGIYVFTNNAETPTEWQEMLETGRLETIPVAPDGQPAFRAYRLNGEILDVENTALHSSLMTFIGSNASQAIAGERTHFEMRWRIDQTPPYYRLRPVLQVTDRNGNLIARNDLFLLGTNQWQAGEVLIQSVPFTIPIGTPPGDYAVEVSWADRDSETFVPFVDESGGYAGISAEIGLIQVASPQAFPPPASLEMDQSHPMDLGDGIRLLGWDNPPASARPGGEVDITLFWEATEPEVEREIGDLQAFVRKSGEDDVLLWEGQPLDGTYAVEDWSDGELLREYATWALPTEAESGEYELVLRSEGNDFVLGNVILEGVPRVFEPPEVDVLMHTNFDDRIELYGYTLSAENGLLFEPVWYARNTIHENFTIFVHIVDHNGLIVTQQDVMPVQNAYPTSLWAQGEYIQDSFYFDEVPAGTYVIRVGFYIQTSGYVLPISDDRINESVREFIEISEITITDD